MLERPHPSPLERGREEEKKISIPLPLWRSKTKQYFNNFTFYLSKKRWITT
jgi:hypothetical protein